MGGQYQNNLGKPIVLNKANLVTNQYGSNGLGAIGRFASVFDSSVGPDADPDDSQLRIYNLMTWIGGYTMPAGDSTRLAILGKLEYGIGGASFEVDFDWKLGTQISIAASFVRVMAAYSEVAASPESVSIAAMMSSGSRAARSQVTRSYPRLIMNDSSPVIFPIPPMAHALNLFSTDREFYEPDGVQVRFIGAANNGFSALATSLESFNYDGSIFLNALANEDGVRFPEAAKFVELSTATVAQDYHVTPCFTLSL